VLSQSPARPARQRFSELKEEEEGACDDGGSKATGATYAAESAMTRRSKSSERWLREHFTDPWVKRAQTEGWRSRAVFKLEEIDRRERLLRPGMKVLDLGAAPGAWSQYARRQVGRTGTVLASDILAMEPLAGVEFVQGDFRDEDVLERLQGLIGGEGVDVLLSDMAPNLSGMDAIDAPRSAYLAELALDMATRVLKGDGRALIKVFQGAGFQELMTEARRRFQRVKFVKPEASRARSPEIYLLAGARRMV
jgi:23S rRNA (uridine2552-2'-O)-methyltransferase